MAEENIQQSSKTNRKLLWWFVIALIIAVLPWIVLGALD